jgi:hypothetical protein
MIVKLVICIGIAFFINALVGYELGQILPTGVATVFSFCVGIIGGFLAVLAAAKWDARRKH